MIFKFAPWNSVPGSKWFVLIYSCKMRNHFFKPLPRSLIYSSEEITVSSPRKPVTDNMKNNVEWELESAKLFPKSVWDVSTEANEESLNLYTVATAKLRRYEGPKNGAVWGKYAEK